MSLAGLTLWHIDFSGLVGTSFGASDRVPENAGEGPLDPATACHIDSAGWPSDDSSGAVGTDGTAEVTAGPAFRRGRIRSETRVELWGPAPSRGRTERGDNLATMADRKTTSGDNSDKCWGVRKGAQIDVRLGRRRSVIQFELLEGEVGEKLMSIRRSAAAGLIVVDLQKDMGALDRKASETTTQGDNWRQKEKCDSFNSMPVSPNCRWIPACAGMTICRRDRQDHCHDSL